MTRETLIQKLATKYNLNIIGESELSFIIQDNGYLYKCKRDFISKFKPCMKSMLRSSYLKYINETILKNTSLQALEIINDDVLILNTDSKVFYTTNKNNIKVNIILNITTKSNKYTSKIIEVLGDKYDYSKCNPLGLKDKVIIICPIHGEFQSAVDNIIYRHSGCPYCAQEYKGYSKYIFNKQCSKNNLGNGKLYILQFYNSKEAFIKVGITSIDLLNKINEFPSTYNIKILEVFEYSSDLIYRIEKNIHREFINYKIIPSVKFNGRTECYKTEVLEKIKKLIFEKLK